LTALLQAGELIVEHDVKQRAVDLQPAIVVNEAQFSEPVHEKTDSRTSGADHLCQGLLTYLWNNALRHTVLAKMSEQKKNARQSLFTRIKQLVNQILLITDIAGQQIRHEQIGKCVFPVKRLHHGFLLNSQQSAIRHGCRRAHSERLACKRTLTEEIPITQYADRRFLASLGDDGESYLARLQIKHRVCGIPLCEDGVLLRKEHGFPALADAG
jgi:hypothetical protein